MKRVLNDNRLSYLWLLIGAALLLFSNGKWMVSIAPWFSMIFILRFLHMQNPLKGIVIGAAVNVAVNLIIFQGVIPLEGILYYVVVGSMGLTSFLPYIIERVLASRSKTYWSAMVFPLVWVTLEYINSLLNPYGSWSTIAYTQYGNLPLMQLLSITGIWGITFLMTWFAATVNWMLDNQFEWLKVRNATIVFLAVFLSIMAYGSLRIVFFKPATENTVRIASFTKPYDITERMEKKDLKKLYNEDPNAFRDFLLEETRELPEIMFEKSKQEALSGAKIVAWSEGALSIGIEREEEITDLGCKLAAEHKIYLMMALSIIPEDFPKQLSENKVIWISPSGEILGEYLKTKIVPGEGCIKGDGSALIMNTPYGRISSLICFDMDFPTFTRNMAKDGIDIMINPSSDWKEIDPLHTNMIMFRAVENGFSLVKVTSKGLSGAYDYQGRVLSDIDYFTEKDQSLISDVPVTGVRTVYSRLGDFTAWISIAGLLLVVIKSCLKKT